MDRITLGKGIVALIDENDREINIIDLQRKNEYCGLEKYLGEKLDTSKSLQEIFPYYNDCAEKIQRKIQAYIADSDTLRICSKCGHIMQHGYYFEGTGDYYCSDACLRIDMTEEEYQQAYEEDEAYWTEWA